MLASVSIDLSEFVSLDGTKYTQHLPLEKGKNPPILTIEIGSTWVRDSSGGSTAPSSVHSDITPLHDLEEISDHEHAEVRPCGQFARFPSPVSVAVCLTRMCVCLVVVCAGATAV